jgi:CRP-like cAMP-binding protein
MKKVLILRATTLPRENLSEILKLNGYAVTEIEFPKLIDIHVADYQPDILLLENEVPTAVLREFRADRATRDVPVILLSDWSNDRLDFRTGMSSGADDYFSRPFDMASLLQTMEFRLKKMPVCSLADHQTDKIISPVRAHETMLHLLENRESRHYRRRDPVFREQELPHNLYYIESGSIKVFKTNPDGREYIMRIAGKGSFLGYLALINEHAYAENATALTDTTIRVIPRAAFQQLVFRDAHVNAHFLHILTDHLSDQDEQLLLLAYSSVRCRVAHKLMWLSDLNASKYLMREDLASIVGTAKESLIRVLTEFKQAGLIDVQNGDIRILKPEKLRAIA